MVGALAVYVSVHDVQFGEATGGDVPDFRVIGAVRQGNPSSPYQISNVKGRL